MIITRLGSEYLLLDQFSMRLSQLKLSSVMLVRAIDITMKEHPNGIRMRLGMKFVRKVKFCHASAECCWKET